MIITVLYFTITIILFFVLYYKSFVNTVCISINMQITQVVVKVEGFC